MRLSKYPSLYQINTRVYLTELSQGLGCKATLDDIPDSDLDRFADMGFDWIWMLSVWTTGLKGQKISQKQTDWRHDFEATLPDLKEEDIKGSGFAIADYKVHPDLGGNAALKRLRTRMKKRGLKLMLDFVPNHMGPDHSWVEEHSEYFVKGTENDLKNEPQNYTHIKNKKSSFILAYGRDPYFAGWPDTIQLNYSNPATIEAMKAELMRISAQCDGVRCDMAMLVLPDVFEKTWGRKAQSFWPEAIKDVHEKDPDFIFMAEVYWDLEWELQQLGFNYTYDKRLYDRLEHGNGMPVREHLFAALDYQKKMARFLENHDEPRAASTFNSEKHKAAAIITFFSPGLRFFHQGQFDGRVKRISPHLIRAPKEPVSKELHSFYTQLLALLKMPVFRNGKWRLLEICPAWSGNETYNSFIAYSWEGSDGRKTLIAINYAPIDGQCYVDIPFPELIGHMVRLADFMSSARYERDGSELLLKGLYLDLAPWGYHVFELGNLKMN